MNREQNEWKRNNKFVGME